MSPLALSLRFLQAQPDVRLAALAREGHTPAFEALVRRYRRELLAYCRRLQPQSPNAEDTLQQALLQAWNALSAGAEVREVRPWLYRIAHNVAMSSLRSSGPMTAQIEETGAAPGVDQVVEQRFAAQAVLANMASLPPLQRQVIVGTALDGESHEEVAQALGLSSGAVRGLVYRARATLRAAAAAITPSPVVGWALRRAEARGGGAPAIVEALVGGSGAGVAGLVLKGGAVISLAGALAGGGALISHVSPHHHAPGPSPAASHAAGAPTIAASSTLGMADGQRSNVLVGPGGRRRIPGPDGRGGVRHRRSGSRSENGGRSSGRSDGGSTSGHDGGSSGGRDGGSTGSTGGRDGGSSELATVTSGSGSGDGGFSSGGSGGSVLSTGSSGGSSSSGSDGGSSGGSGQVTTTTTSFSTSTSSGSDGGSSGGSGSSGSGDTTTTTITSSGH